MYIFYLHRSENNQILRIKFFFNLYILEWKKCKMMKNKKEHCVMELYVKS